MKTVVLYQRPGSNFDIKHRIFDSNEVAAMQRFINDRTSAGFACHEFTYVASYRAEKTIVRSISTD